MRNRKHIIFLDTGTWYGGAQRSLFELVSALNTDVQLTVLAADQTPGGLLDQCLRREIDAHAIKAAHWRRTPETLFSMASSAVSLRRKVHSLFPEPKKMCLVHANTPKAALLATLALPETTLVTHLRDTRFPLCLKRWLLRRSAAAVAISKAVKAEWTPYARTDNVKVIYNGLPINEIMRMYPAESLRRDLPFRIIQVADMVKWKRHDLFIDALRLVYDSRPDIEAAIVGRPLNAAGTRLFAELQAQAHRLGLTQVLKFYPACACALEIVAGGDLLVNTAANEPFGRSIVEAMACGKPVVSVAEGGPAEILAGCDTAALVPADAAELAGAILKFIERTPDPEVSANVVARAKQFDIARTAREIRHLYTTLI